LRSECTGIYPDGWSGAGDSVYYRFSGGAGKWLRVVVSRKGWDGPTGPSPAWVKLGPIVANANHQPVIGHVARTLNLTIANTETKVCWLRAPADRFGASVVVLNKFIPSQLDPKLYSDPRALGVEVSYGMFRTLPPNAKPNTCR